VIDETNTVKDELIEDEINEDLVVEEGDELDSLMPSIVDMDERIEKHLGDKFKKKDIASLSSVAVNSYINYAAAVILGRAIPDLRDGLKHAQRRALVAMKDVGLSDVGGTKKSARITGTIIGKYHPHGDVSAYETMVNMAQPWKNNLTTILGQGNWGSIDGDQEASQRYTEAKFSKAGYMFFRDIDKNVVDFVPNYDGTEEEPIVLPVPFPAVLINGILAGSIAVGMATALLPHNPTEVMNALRFILNNRINKKETSDEDILALIPAPDFPTGGIVYNTQSMLGVIKTGRGSVRVRAKHNIESEGRKQSIIITEIPYSNKKSSLIDEVVAIRQSKKDALVAGISNIKDESDSNIRIVIDIKSGYDPELVWNYILKNTSFDTSISYFCIVLDTIERDGEIVFAPREYGIHTILNRYLDYRIQVITKKWIYIKTEADKKVHILEGLIRAIDIIDDIIRCIKQSKKAEVAAETIMTEFGFSRLQTAAILSMRLSRLTSMEKNELVNDKKEQDKIIKEATKVLKDENYKYSIIDTEFEEVKNIIGYPRKTEIVAAGFQTITKEEVIPEEECMIIVTEKGYIKKINSKQMRAGKTTIDLTDGDEVRETYETTTHNSLVLVSKTGTLFSIKAFDVSESNTFVKNIFDIEDDFFCFMSNMTDNLVIITENSMIKQSSMKDFVNSTRKSGLPCITLKSGLILNAFNATGAEDIFMVTKNAKAIRFSLSDVSVTGRTSQGVAAMKVKKDDTLLAGKIYSDNIQLVTETSMEKDVGKMSVQSRAGVGVFVFTTTKKSGLIKYVI
jgi:DNA gyrase subunit A